MSRFTSAIAAIRAHRIEVSGPLNSSARIEARSEVAALLEEIGQTQAAVEQAPRPAISSEVSRCVEQRRPQVDPPLESSGATRTLDTILVPTGWVAP